MFVVMKTTCSNTAFNIGDMECKEIANPLKDVDEALQQLCKSAMYSINLRPLKQSDYKHIRIEYCNDSYKYRQTIFYKDVKRAEITANYIVYPIIFKLETYPA